MNENANPLEGESSERAGLPLFEVAMAFVKEFPIGTTVTAVMFDEWAETNGLLALPNYSVHRQSDTWKAHVCRRHELRYRLNKAGTHSRLRYNGSTPFCLDSIGNGVYAVRAPQVAIVERGLAKRVASLMVTKQRELRYLMASADWSLLPPNDKTLAEMITYDMENFGEIVSAQEKFIAKKLVLLEQKLKDAGVNAKFHETEAEDVEEDEVYSKQSSSPIRGIDLSDLL